MEEWGKVKTSLSKPREGGGRFSSTLLWGWVMVGGGGGGGRWCFKYGGCGKTMIAWNS